MRAVRFLRPIGRIAGMLSAVFLGLMMSSTPSFAQTAITNPAVGAIVTQVNDITCQIRSGGIGCAQGPGPIDVCRYIPYAVPEVCGHPQFEPCRYIPSGIPGTCGNDIPPTDPCYYVPSGTPGVCGNPLPQPCDYVPTGTPGVCGNPLPVVCNYIPPNIPGTCGNPLPSQEPCDYVPSGTPGVCGNPLPSTNPCDYVPVGTPGVCGNPYPSTVDLTSAHVAIAIGNLTQDINAAPGDLGRPQALLGLCQPSLDTFLGNTKYLGPLIDYAICINTNSVPAVLATLPTVTGGVHFLAGVCSIVTQAAEKYDGGVHVNFSGTTDCSAGRGSANVFKPLIQHPVGTSFGNYLYEESFAGSSSTTSGPGWLRSAGVMYDSIDAASRRPGKHGGSVGMNTLVTSISPQELSVCTASGVNCGFTWVVLPDKNPDAAAELSCKQVGNKLTCTSYGIPLTDSTISP